MSSEWEMPKTRHELLVAIQAMGYAIQADDVMVKNVVGVIQTVIDEHKRRKWLMEEKLRTMPPDTPPDPKTLS